MFRGEMAVVCTCFGGSETTVADLIESNNTSDIAEISAACDWGITCGSCRMLIRELIHSTAPNGG